MAARAQDFPNYHFTTLAGAADQGGSRDGIGAEARFNQPTELAVDREGNLYVFDSDAGAGPSFYSLRRISPSGAVTTVARNLRAPTGLALDPAGNIFITQFQVPSIQRLAPDGSLSVFAGGPMGGAFGESRDGLATAATFFRPNQLAFDPAGNLFVADDGYFNVRRITPAAAVTTLAGSGQSESLDGTGKQAGFRNPYAVACDVAGNVILSDGGRALRKITPAGVVTTFAGSLEEKGSADGPGALARFTAIGRLAAHPSGDLVLTDYSSAIVRLVSPSGAVTTIAGQPGQTGTTDGIAGAARFRSPFGVAVDAAGNIFIADLEARTIRKGTRVDTPGPPIFHTPWLGSGEFSRNVGAGSTLTLTGAASGSGIAFQWSKNNAPLAGATNATLTLRDVTVADEGAYQLAATTAGGTTTSREYSVRVYTPTLAGFTTRRAVTGGSFLWGLATNGAQLVAVGTGGKILTSNDGVGWVARESTTREWLVGVTFGDGKFVAVGDRGVILVSREGIAWTRAANSTTTQRLNGVAWEAGTFVAVGEAGTIVTSPDAQTWTARNSGVTTWLRGIVYRPFEPVTSSPPAPAPNVFYFVSGDNGSARFYAAGQNGVLLSSRDRGATWTALNVLPPKDVEALIPGPTGIGQDGVVVRMQASYYRQQLAGKTPSFPGGLTSLTISDITFATWHSATIGFPARFRGVAAGAGAIFATGENGVIAGAASHTGPWAIIPSGTTANLVAGVFHGNSLYVVGENETILQSQPLHASRLINIATRARVGTDGHAMHAGFVVSGSAPKQILLRAAGPALGSLGLDGTLAAPVLTLFDREGRPLRTNARWSAAASGESVAAAEARATTLSETAARVGAFPFANGSADAALLITLAPGAYTAQVASADGTNGVALVEAYDAENLAAQGSRAVNLSTRARVGAGADQLIAGFVINGVAARRVLVRAVGPSLAPFGVNDFLPAPKLTLVDDRGRILQTAGAWTAQPDPDVLRGAALLAGAFALQEESQDAALVATLLPGAYTVQVASSDERSGTAIVEVYDLP